MELVIWCEVEEVDVDVSNDGDVCGGGFCLNFVDCCLEILDELLYLMILRGR